MGKYPGTVIMRKTYPKNRTTSNIKDPGQYGYSYKFYSNRSIQRILAPTFAKDIHVCQAGMNRTFRNKLLSDVSTSSQS